jgi:hypothetical protein
LVVVLCALAIASPLLALRWPAGFLLRKWRLPLLVWVTLVFQVIVLEVELPGILAPVLHVLTYVAAATFLWLNRRVPGTLVVAAGALCNGVTIALNGGVLPSSRAAVEAAGIEHDAEFANTAVVENPVLPWLGDVFAWPAPMPLANTFSVGDVLIVAGVVVLAWSGSRRFGEPAVRVDESADVPTGAAG